MSDKIVDFSEKSKDKNKTEFEKNAAIMAEYCEQNELPCLMVYFDEFGNPAFIANMDDVDNDFIALLERCKNHIVNYGTYPEDED